MLTNRSFPCLQSVCLADSRLTSTLQLGHHHKSYNRKWEQEQGLAGQMRASCDSQESRQTSLTCLFLLFKFFKDDKTNQNKPV